MAIDDQIEDEKLQYDISREAAKISALSLGRINTYEYLTSEKCLLIKNKQQNKLNLHLHHMERPLKNNQKQRKSSKKQVMLQNL